MRHGPQFWEKALWRKFRSLDAMVMQRAITEQLVLKTFNLVIEGKRQCGQSNISNVHVNAVSDHWLVAVVLSQVNALRAIELSQVSATGNEVVLLV